MNERSPRELADRISDVIGRAQAPRLLRLDSLTWRVGIGGILGLAVIYLLWGLANDAPKTRYITEPVIRGGFTVAVSATGSVQPTNQVDVSSELSGTVRKVLVDYNSPVKVGEVLAELDTDKLKATVDSSRAKLAAAKAKVSDAKATLVEKELDFVRKQALEARKVTSAHDLEIAKAAFDRARAAVANADADVGVAEADLRINETNLDKACICSPIDGVILERNVDPGQTVASSLQAPVLFSIAEDLKKMEIRVDVDEADVGRVKVAQTATFTVDAYPDRKFPAEIREVRYAPEVVQGVVTYKAILAIDNSDLLLRPGMTATAEIIVEKVEGELLAPNAALRFSPPSENAADDKVSLLRRIIPGPPRFRAASKHDETGASRTLWVLRNGVPEGVSVEIGATDGKLTAIKKGEIVEGDLLIVGTAAGAG